MSKEKGEETTCQSSKHQAIGESSIASSAQSEQHTTPVSPRFPLFRPPRAGAELDPHHAEEEGKQGATRNQALESKAQNTEEETSRPRQVIAVSASKGPAAFFNLARKFLVTDEMCDLSALEGAIVSAVDAAHLLERSKLANIVRIQTSYVTVEPKRRKQASAAQSPQMSGSQGVTSPLPIEGIQGHIIPSSPGSTTESQTRRTSTGRELRRARIVITVRRTESYKRWLEENPLQAIIAGDAEEVSGVDAPDERR